MGNRIRQRRSENSISRGLGSPHSMIGPPRAGLLSVLRTGYVVSRPPLICEFRLWFPFVTEFPFLDQTRKVLGFLDCSTSIPLQIFYLGR
ncbi:uncharacterized protein CCOS01_06448 [Colletotrichum costaricense]|uniref:Uncharacterized protein n=1 Tax=Colletotrichum costaricense TaxID=1209916 RepID=A0AAJ0E230_9PEZI|nr:uncharacterized protein CCOS01_06448 [Colletotrichum costaricense]KAK1528614.1 hypothetical protein CCOS01_06448 [Colletotrichum costaricense]